VKIFCILWISLEQKQPCIKTFIFSRETRLENAAYSGTDPPGVSFMLLVVKSGQKAAISTSWMTTVVKAFFNDTDGALSLPSHFLHCCHMKDKTELSGSQCKHHGFILVYEKSLERGCLVSRGCVKRRKCTCRCLGVIREGLCFVRPSDWLLENLEIQGGDKLNQRQKEEIRTNK